MQFQRMMAVIVVVATLALGAPAWAQRGPRGGGRGAAPDGGARPTSQPADGEGAVDSSDHLSTTEGQVTVDGQPLAYTATAGTMDLKDEAGKSRANFFFVSYTQKSATTGPEAERAAASRPITFVFNGGPGAAAVWVHLGGAGPHRLDLNDDGTPPAPPVALVENESTWLAFTDLVFIDPVGTGFSRPTDPRGQQDFSGVRNDIQSIADFIRLYTTRNRRWLSPKFLAGESYGTTRAAALSDYLMGHAGMDLNGIIFLSSVLNFEDLEPDPSNDVPYPLYVPTYAAVAWYHKKLEPALQGDLTKTLDEVVKWTTSNYTTALARGSTLSAADRQDVIQHLARYTGLPPDLIDRAQLRIEPGIFRKQLLADRRMLLGRFDGRMTGNDADPLSEDASYDPSESRYLATYTTAFNDYVRRTLHFDSDLPYESLTGRVQPWDYQSQNHFLYVADDLRMAMLENPHLKVMFAMGYYDLATPFQSQLYTIQHMNLPADVQGNVLEKFYSSGHMIYHVKDERIRLRGDVSDFIRSAVGAKR